jgi:hypothetical protein
LAEARHPALATRVVAVQALACRVRREFADARPFALLSGRPAIRTERIHEAHNCDSDFQCRSPRVDPNPAMEKETKEKTPLVLVGSRCERRT